LTYQELEKDGNVGIKFDEMSSDEILRKLAIVEQDPDCVWAGIGKAFKRGFFFSVIEREFGITPDTHGKLINRFDGKLKEIVAQNERAIQQLCASFEKESRTLT
jgi:hypothetical protein